MRRSPILPGLLLVAVASGCFCGPSQGHFNDDGALTIQNASRFVITELLITPMHSSTWGPNLLSDVLFPGEQITVRVQCDTSDALIADEFGRDCVLPAIDLCFSNQRWVIDDRTLRLCNF